VSRDPVVAAIEELAAASFPGVYAPDPHLFPVAGSPLPESSGSHRPPFTAVADHPARGQAVEALRRDDVLAQLFAGPTDIGVFLTTSLGRGWRLRAEHVPGALVASAARRVIAQGLDVDSAEHLLAEVPRAVDEARRLLGAEEGHAFTLTAFEGFALPEGAVIELPWGALRSASEIERGMQPFGEVAPSVVLVTRPPVRFYLDEPPPGGLIGDADEVRRLGLIGQHLALALLLAVEGEDFAVADQVWQSTILPLQLGWGFSGKYPPGRMFPPSPGEPLSERQIADLRDWAERIHRGYDPSVQIAVQRTLSAIRERSDPQDALIDAVIAWENLFGHGGLTEVTFRVTAALALLLETEAPQRREARSRFGQVYSTRSKVVHGAEIDDPADLELQKETAVRTAVDALRTLFRDRPDLLPERHRGLELILGSEGASPGGSAA
jgi:hypothetical protein